jgi:fatty acid desaturase
MRPPAFIKLIGSFFGIPEVIDFFPRMIRNALSGPTLDERTFVPQSEWRKVQRVAIIYLAIYAATLGWAVWMQSILPLMVIGLPRMYGAWHHVMTGLLQHGGLADNVITIG